jgi:hypothetical protein
MNLAILAHSVSHQQADDLLTILISVAGACLIVSLVGFAMMVRYRQARVVSTRRSLDAAARFTRKAVR